MMTRLIRLALASVLACSMLATVASAATIIIVNNDGAGEGFNDPTPVAPVGGNPGTTIGSQRLFIFQYAANIWGATLPSTITIQVRSAFNPLTCTATSAVLGSAGPVTIHRDFAGAPFTGTWYHAALANRLNGTDLSATNPDINATFNSALDGGTCLGGATWYYGIDGNEGAQVELLPVVLHEMGHGLGFSTTTNGTSGAFNTGFPSVFDRFLFDNVTGLTWNNMSATQRVASAISVDKLAWSGPAVAYGASTFLSPRPRMVVSSPGGIAGTYGANVAAFGPQSFSLTGQVVLADDGVAPNSDGCTGFVNAGAIAGNIALIDRGTCTFVVKAAAAQAAGAIGVIIANNAAGALAPGGADPSITIPVMGITQADGNTLKANLGSGVTVNLGFDPTLRAGADNAGRPLMYAPNPFQSGSSVSHYDVTLTPNALMEPAINNSLSSNVDLTKHAFVDIGWMDFSTATTLSHFTAEDRTGGILLAWEFVDASDVGTVTVERAQNEIGPWEAISTELDSENGRSLALDTHVEPGTTYFYRLSVMDRSGTVAKFGFAAGRHSSGVSGPAVLLAPSPNPSPRGSTVAFRISNPEFVRLSIVDASGRTVRTLRNGMASPGEYTHFWDGVSESGQRVPAGLYFITLTTSQGRNTQRLAVVR